MEEKEKSKLPLVTIILVAVNVLVFFISDLFLYERQDEVAFYMALNPMLFLKGKQYWRLFTSMFYHFGIEHLMCNMLMLYFVGARLEPLLGRLRFLSLFLFSGLMADAASVFYNGFLVPENAMSVFSAGASGAVYGLIGAFVSFFLFVRERLHKQEKIRLALAVFCLLFGSILDTGVGHEAHFGGFFAGLLFGCLYCLFMRRKGKTIELTRAEDGGSR